MFGMRSDVCYYVLCFVVTAVYAELAGFLFYKLCIDWREPEALPASSDDGSPRISHQSVSASRVIIHSILTVCIYAAVHGTCSKLLGMSGTTGFYATETVGVVLIISTMVFISNRMPQKRLGYTGKSIKDYHCILMNKVKEKEGLIAAEKQEGEAQ